MPEPLFDCGYLVATPTALDLVEEHQVDLPDLFSRHLRGDWGEVGDDGAEANQETIRIRVGTVLSSSTVTPGGDRLWVATAFSEPEDLSTYVMLPSEW